MGQGPMTGRQAGYCAGFPRPGYMNPVGGMGFGRGGGFGGRGGRGFGGRGWRNRYYATGLTGWQRAAMYDPAFVAPVAAPVAPIPAAPTSEQQVGALK